MAEATAKPKQPVFLVVVDRLLLLESDLFGFVVVLTLLSLL